MCIGLIINPIAGMGSILERGNQQISPDVTRNGKKEYNHSFHAHEAGTDWDLIR